MVYPKSILPMIYTNHSQDLKKLKDWFKNQEAKAAYEVTLDMKIKGSKGQGETEAKAIVIDYGGNWVLYGAGEPDDLVYVIQFHKISDIEKSETEAERKSANMKETETYREDNSQIQDETLKNEELKDNSQNLSVNDKNIEEINQTVLSYSKELLLHDERFTKYETGFSIIDVNGDGIYEVYVLVQGNCSAENAAYLIYAKKDGNCMCTALLDDYFGYNPQKGQIIAMKVHMGIAVEIFELQEGILHKIDEFTYYDKDDPQYKENPKESDRNEKKCEQYVEQVISPETIRTTPGNVEHYLGENGMQNGEYEVESSTEASEDQNEEAGTSFSEVIQEVDLDTEIKHIRETYAYTNEHIGEYEKTSTNKNTDVWDSGCESTYFYADNVQVKQIIKDDSLYIEVYGKNPALVPDALPTQEVFPEQMAEFIFATYNGDEYRIYMKDERVIRYIGPDHVNVDYAQSINLDDFCLSEAMKVNGGDEIVQIINRAFPGWWVPYEGERD